MLHFFLTVLALSAAATVANIKISYDVKTPQFAIFGTRVICMFYSISFTLANDHSITYIQQLILGHLHCNLIFNAIEPSQ